MTSTVPADRYGRAPSARRRWGLVGVVAVVVLAALGWFGWAAVRGTSAATATTIGFSVISDGQATVTFDVTRPKDRTASCVVQALDTGFGVVGTLTVPVGPSSHTLVRRLVTVQTTNRATSAQVSGCTLSG